MMLRRLRAERVLAILLAVSGLTCGYLFSQLAEVRDKLRTTRAYLREQGAAQLVLLEQLHVLRYEVHVLTHDESILRQIADARGPSYLVIGDSITASAELPPACGLQPVNAGISGAAVATFLDLGPKYARLLRPELVV